MFVKPFRYERAASLADAAAMLREAAGSAKVLAGGQSLLPMMNLGVLDLEALIDVSHVEHARGVEREDGYLSIGALTTHGELERDPAIARRAAARGRRRPLDRVVAHPRARHAGRLARALRSRRGAPARDGRRRRDLRTDRRGDEPQCPRHRVPRELLHYRARRRRADRACPCARARPRVGLGVRGGVASSRRLRVVRRGGARPHGRRADRGVAARSRGRRRPPDATRRGRDRGGGGGRGRACGEDRSAGRARARAATSARPPSTVATCRGCSRCARSPTRSRVGWRRERDRRDGDPHRERRADDPHDRRAPVPVALAARRRRRDRSQVRLRRGRLRRLHGARGRRARERVHRARRAGRRLGGHDRRRTLRARRLPGPAAATLPRAPRGAMRVLHAGHAAVRPRDAPRRRRSDDARRDPRAAARQPLSLYRLHGHRRCDRGRAKRRASRDDGRDPHLEARGAPRRPPAAGPPRPGREDRGHDAVRGRSGVRGHAARASRALAGAERAADPA